jgi:hypothetical protein
MRAKSLANKMQFNQEALYLCYLEKALDAHVILKGRYGFHSGALSIRPYSNIAASRYMIVKNPYCICV